MVHEFRLITRQKRPWEATIFLFLLPTNVKFLLVLDKSLSKEVKNIEMVLMKIFEIRELTQLVLN